MESFESLKMHATDTKPICSTLPCASDGSDEISNKLENDLLYGANDDGDEDDAQSDDSLRLRLSDDDDVDVDDIGASLPVDNQLKQSEKLELLDMELNISTSIDYSMQHENNSIGIYSLKDKYNDFDKDIDFTNKDISMENNLSDTAIENTSHKDNTSTGNENTQDLETNNIELITADNNSLKLIESNLSSDKLNLSLSIRDKSLSSVNFQNKPKENGIIEKYDDNVIKNNEISEISSSGSINTDKKIVNELDVEKLNVLTNEETKDDDDDDAIVENPVIKNVEYQESSADNPNDKDTEDVQSSVLGITLITSTDSSPKAKIISNDVESSTNSRDISINANIKSVNETIFEKTENLEIKLTKVLDNNATTDLENGSSNSENCTVPNSGEHDDKKKKIEENEIGTKRPLSVSDDETVVPKKTILQGLLTDKPTLVDEVEMAIPTVDVSSTTKKSTESKSTAVPEIIIHKSEKKNDELNNINIKSKSPEEKTPILAIEILDDDDDDDESLDKDDEKLEITAVIQPTETSARARRRRRKRKIITSVDIANSGQEKENVRQKRETAQKAEEIIRKRFLSNDSDSESSNDVTAFDNDHKPNSRSKSTSPPPFKRNCIDEPAKSNMEKKSNKESDTSASKTIGTVKSNNICKSLEHVRKFFWRNGKKSLSKFTQEELEELLIQKIIETITMRDEIGKLREQAKISERNQEATRLKCQQLSKQIKDFEMVLSRFSADRRTGDKNTPPIKINRSVGLQVNFVTDNGVQNLRQLQHNMRSNVIVANGGNSPNKQPSDLTNTNPNVRKGIKVRSPRRTSDAVPVSPVVSSTSTQIQSSVTSAATPAALLVQKSTDNRNAMSSGGQVITQQGTITVNGSVITTATATTTTTTSSRQSKILNVRNNNNKTENLIDLTGEEEKNKSVTNPPPLCAITTGSNSTTALKTSPRYQRIIQPPPPNVTVSQSTYKIVQSADKPTPTAIVNNVNAPRLAFVMHGITGQRQLLIPSNSNSIRPAVTTNPRASFPAITYTGVQTIPNGSVRVVPAITTTAPAQKYKHPAPLPGVTTYPINPTLKLPPPAPSLKISKVANGGIVLSWNMRNSDEYAEIASYQLYAYQEVTGMAPNTALWKKVGDVRALPLPMACTLTQFSEGNNYYFAVRAVDTHSRLGQYSQPGNISL